ncbi:uracil-DNA glycosylase [Paenibacillus sambharensis]|uniref:Uracil-DNA glycosylase n=1 Tax=Paenibacillus sambharensis TaxID=1803190 RepID=A0A2W1LI55_9BACL|nr:uracil-DNA glycosylase [Paenibacillus sambharensis]PZD94204.1 uracil-DNA glycosylase [Paenibacillus sambharensis]
MTEAKRIDCMKCKHFYVTWDPGFPRGCRAFGFKTKSMPSQTVLSSSGQPCMNFELKGTGGKDQRSG